MYQREARGELTIGRDKFVRFNEVRIHGRWKEKLGQKCHVLSTALKPIPADVWRDFGGDAENSRIAKVLFLTFTVDSYYIKIFLALSETLLSTDQV